MYVCYKTMAPCFQKKRTKASPHFKSLHVLYVGGNGPMSTAASYGELMLKR